MSVAVSYPHITKNAGETARMSRLPRIRVAQIVMDYLAFGWSVEEICRQHPSLTPAEVHAAMLYYWDHQDEIDGEIRAEYAQAVSEGESAPPSPFLLRLRAQGLR